MIAYVFSYSLISIYVHIPIAHSCVRVKLRDFFVARDADLTTRKQPRNPRIYGIIISVIAFLDAIYISPELYNIGTRAAKYRFRGFARRFPTTENITPFISAKYSCLFEGFKYLEYN